MSQYHFARGPFRVVAGWDPPLRQHFLTVDRRDTGALVYSNLADTTLPPGGGMTARQVIARLHKLGIVPPPMLLAMLDDDAEQAAARW